MEPYLSRIEAFREKYHLRWLLEKNPHAFVIAIGTSSNLCDTSRIFVIPGHIRSCDLDLGPGQWYGRIGSMIGDEYKGHIVWSGVYGPHAIQSNKSILPPIQPTISVSQTIPIENGLRFRIGSSIPGYYIFQTWVDDPIVGKWTYYKDIGRGYADCGGIIYQTNYNIYIRHLESIPHDTIVQLADGILCKGTSAKPTPILDSTDHAIRAAGNAVLRQTTFQQNVRFASHADYVRYKAALAKVSGGI